MRESFITKRFNGKSKALLEKIFEILDKYKKQEIRLTLRQLYYQLVSGGIIANRQPEYFKLSRLLTDARMAGLVDWDAIEDRIRVPKIPQFYESPQEIVEIAAEYYETNCWAASEKYVELYTEKDALSSILYPIAAKWRVPFTVNRGFSSTTALYDASKRFLSHPDKECVLLYIGDHDPSGLDMVRDVSERLHTFECVVKVEQVALLKEQISQFNLPPNPTKHTDSRAAKYSAQYGEGSWEVDALPPEVLTSSAEGAIARHLDKKLLQDAEIHEAKVSACFIELAKTLGD